MRTHYFALIASGIAEITPELADVLLSATRGDIELELCDGAAILEFERKAPTLREAILAAIREVESADVGVRVLRVDSEGATVIARINADLSEVVGG